MAGLDFAVRPPTPLPSDDEKAISCLPCLRLDIWIFLLGSQSGETDLSISRRRHGDPRDVGIG